MTCTSRYSSTTSRYHSSPGLLCTSYFRYVHCWLYNLHPVRNYCTQLCRYVHEIVYGRRQVVGYKYGVLYVSIQSTCDINIIIIHRSLIIIVRVYAKILPSLRRCANSMILYHTKLMNLETECVQKVQMMVQTLIYCITMYTFRTNTELEMKKSCDA